MTIAAITLTDWIGAAAIILGAIVIIIGARRLFKTLARRSIIQSNVGDLATQTTAVIVSILAALYSMSRLDVEIGPLLGALGVSGVILGISLQPVLGNFIGSVMLNSSQPVRIGDQVNTNGVDGTVVDITNRAVEILTFDGVAVHLPNLKVLEQPLTNFTHDDDRRTVMPFQVGYETDLRTAQQVVVKGLRDVAGVNEIPGPEVIVVGFADAGVSLEARFWHASEELIARWAVSEAGIAIRESLREANIEIPYPQVVVHPSRGDNSANSDSTQP